MINRIKISGVAVAADTDGLATADICTGAGPWVLDNATEMPDGLAHKVTITQAGSTNHSAKTAIITGTDANGAAQVETALALPNGATTVTSTKYFLSVTSVAISATIGADTMTMGWAADSVSPWKTIEDQEQTRNGFNMGIGCTVSEGSPTYAVQYTYDGVAAFTHATITGKTANFAAAQDFPVGAIRLLWTAAGGVNLTALQA